MKTGGKTVKLSAYTAEMLEEYRELCIRYEKLVNTACGMNVQPPEDNNALVRKALRAAIDEIRKKIKDMECIKEGEGAHHDA